MNNGVALSYLPPLGLRSPVDVCGSDVGSFVRTC